jgi:sialate O-acetylesterase
VIGFRAPNTVLIEPALIGLRDSNANERWVQENQVHLAARRVSIQVSPEPARPVRSIHTDVFRGDLSMQSLLRAAVVAAILLAFACLPARADVKPHPLFTDGVVLQRGKSVPVWGTADPGETVAISLYRDEKWLGAARPAPADKDGHWRFNLPFFAEAGGPYELRISSKANTVIVKNILVGEVWVCSGQSNMEMTVKSSANADSVKQNSANPKIRLFKVTNGPSMTPERDVQGKWVECGPGTVESFSAVGYHFGKYLQEKLNVPVGLIQNAWGGTPADVWTSRTVLESDPKLKHIVTDFEQRIRDYPKQLEAYAIVLEKYKEVAEKAKSEGKPVPKAPKKPDDPEKFVYNAPFLLYNSRIATLIPFAIRGAIWYQGESNAGPFRAEEYGTLFPAMIKNWRHDWGQGDFPFLFVQLAPFMKIRDEPTDTAWAWLREAQRQTSLTVPDTAMAVITDVGDQKDIHPKQKQPVGERLAFAALAMVYDQKVPYTGPVYDSMKVADGKAIVTFKNAENGLEARGGDLTGFTVAGKDGKFVHARAELQGNQVIVSSPAVPEPAAVRFGWAEYPVVNLWGKDGLPASPFRTDDFPAPWKKPSK